MNEMDLLTRMRNEIPVSPPSGRAEAALLAAISQEPAEPFRPTRYGLSHWAVTWVPGWPPRGRAWRPVLAGGLAVALAAVLGVTLAVQPSSAPPRPGSPPLARGYTVAELAAHASAAAAALPVVRPGQWVYRKVFLAGSNPHGQYRIWTTANDRTAAYWSGDKVRLIHGPFRGLPTVFRSPGGFTGATWASGWPLIRYAQLRSLPRSPDALRKYLLGTAEGGPGPPSLAFSLIEFMLTSYVMPPGLTAELYQVLAGLPTVTVDNRAVDAAGRPGVGFAIPEGPHLPHRPQIPTDEIIISATTFRFMGTRYFNLPGRGDALLSGGTSVLQQSDVPGPGVLP